MKRTPKVSDFSAYSIGRGRRPGNTRGKTDLQGNLVLVNATTRTAPTISIVFVVFKKADLWGCPSSAIIDEFAARTVAPVHGT